MATLNYTCHEQSKTQRQEEEEGKKKEGRKNRKFQLINSAYKIFSSLREMSYTHEHFFGNMT